MGYDISYHPVDLSFFHEQLFPIIRGERGGDELFARAGRIAKTRFIANAYGLAVWGVNSDRRTASETPPPAKPSLVQRLFGRTPAPARAVNVPSIGRFDSDLHLWGRPFFVVGETTEQIAATTDRYVDASDDDAASAVARDNVAALDPALPGSDAFARHLDEQLKSMPEDAQLAQQACWKIKLFRDCFKALGTGESVRDPDGDEHDPEGLFSTDFISVALEFASLFRPGWMDRGTVWPTLLMKKAGLDPSQFFQTPQPMFAPLLEKVPQIAEKFDTTITENYMLGGYVPAAQVVPLIELIEANVPVLKAVYDKDVPEPVPLYVRKQLEALRDAKLRNLAFAEATEIYSGPLGMMN